MFLTSNDPVAEYHGKILGFQSSFLLVKAALLRVNKADPVAGQENNGIPFLFLLRKKTSILKLVVGRALLCSCFFSLAISRSTNPLDWPFCCCLRPQLRAGLMPEKCEALLQMT